MRIVTLILQRLFGEKGYGVAIFGFKLGRNYGMPDEEICGFQEMWTTEQTDYVLLNVGDNRYTIVRLSTNMLVTIEDDDEFRNVIQKMISMLEF